MTKSELIKIAKYFDIAVNAADNKTMIMETLLLNIVARERLKNEPLKKKPRKIPADLLKKYHNMPAKSYPEKLGLYAKKYEPPPRIPPGYQDIPYYR